MSPSSTLLLRLAGPMQSWGTQSRFDVRDSGLEPSKSGVVGLLCAALGRPRSEPVDDLAALRLGVRVEREGVLRSDFQTAGAARRPDDPSFGVYTANGKRGLPVVSRRGFLADADFVVGLESADAALLRRVDDALHAPVWQLFLGRKGYVPGLPIPFPGGGVHEGVSLEECLTTVPLPPGLEAGEGPGVSSASTRLVIEVDLGSADHVRNDQPVGAAFRDRSFAPRGGRTQTFRPPWRRKGA
jgi:CRISPR system Cascade subunit CasD